MKKDVNNSHKVCPRGKKNCPIFDEIIDLQNQIAELTKTSRTDHLTGLYNVKYFYAALDQELERTERTRQPTTLIMLDIDHFKSVNDTHGHVVGDQALKHISETIKKSVRKLDIPCRYGGEEFVIILLSMFGLVAIQVAERIRTNIESSLFKFNERELNLTASLGLDSFTVLSEDTIEEFIERTDKLLLVAKQKGRNRLVHAKTEIQPSVQVSAEEKSALFDQSKDPQETK